MFLYVSYFYAVSMKAKAESNTCCSAFYMRRTQDKKHFTISDWHELMIPQCSMWPSIARLSEQLDLQFQASLSLHSAACKLLLTSHPTEDRRLSWPEHTVG